MEETSELKDLQVKVDRLEQLMERLQQENRDKAEQFTMMAREVVEAAKGTAMLATVTESLNRDFFRLEEKLVRYIPGFNQLNCKVCGKKISNPTVKCPFCSEAKPVVEEPSL